jgi:predicted RNase H-like nuclease (RuvC/YqgF family)
MEKKGLKTMANVELPDFNEMQELIQMIKRMSYEVSKLDTQIKYLESITFRKGKEQGMAVNYIDNAFKTTGFDDEILPLRVELAEKTAELNALKHELELNKSLIEVWRSIQATERIGLS